MKIFGQHTWGGALGHRHADNRTNRCKTASTRTSFVTIAQSKRYETGPAAVVDWARNARNDCRTCCRKVSTVSSLEHLTMEPTCRWICPVWSIQDRIIRLIGPQTRRHGAENGHYCILAGSIHTVWFAPHAPGVGQGRHESPAIQSASLLQPTRF